MKKIFISVLTLGALVANAQDSTQKKIQLTKNTELTFTSKAGHEVLPQAGDLAIGISATAPLTYFGGVLSNGGNGAGAFNSANQNGNVPTSGATTVFGKYMVSSNTAYRFHVSTFGNRTTALSGRIADDGDVNNFVQDKRTIVNRGMTLAGGIEKRRGYTRLIGVYGAEAVIGFNQGNKTSFDYANEISAANQTPTNGFGAVDAINVPGIANNRTVSSKVNSGFSVGAQVFAGVEYFVAPRISLGGEFNWGIHYLTNTSTSTTVEFFNTNTNAVEEFTEVTKNGSQLRSGTGTLGGNVNLLFYF